MPAKLFSAAIFGLKTYLITVEVDISRGLHSFTIVGLPDLAINESKQRISSAIKNSGLIPPKRSHRLIVNLAPANIKKQGPAYDLPIALGFLIASKQIQFNSLNKLFIGELYLSGRVRKINSILPIAIKAKKLKYITELYVPEANAPEAYAVNKLINSKTKLKILPIKNLPELISHLKGNKIIKPYTGAHTKSYIQQNNEFKYDMAYIKGQEHIKRAIEIAVSGWHNIIMIGPPGSGKSLLAKTIPSILPKLSAKEKLNISTIHSIAGELNNKNPLIMQRPFRAPHHTSSQVSLVGGGTFPRPGEISLAHKGVLFLDELPEFPRSILESLRQPLENKMISIARSQYRQTFPADFMLVAAMNPCPCGYYGSTMRECVCSSGEIIRYNKKISGPLLDRIDLQIRVPEISYKKLSSKKLAETSSEIRKRVQKAWNLQIKKRGKVNSQLNIKEIEKYCKLDKEAQDLIKNAMQKNYISARAYHRLLKLSRTIADLANHNTIKKQHIAEALQYRLNTELL